MAFGLSQKERNDALWQALQSGKADAIRQALARGGDPNMQVPDSQKHVLSYALDTYHSSDARQRCQLLLEAGADPNIAEADGTTPLFYAARRAANETLALMLEKGADPLIKNAQGRTALHAAASDRNWTHFATMLSEATLDRLPKPVRGDKNSMLLFELASNMISAGGYSHSLKPLVEKIPDLSLGVEFGHALAHSAISHGNASAFELLSSRPDFDINAVQRGGRTLLHIALSNENLDVARTLMSKGADISVADQNGRTALDYAASAGASPLLTQILRKLRAAAGDNPLDTAPLNRALLLAAGRGHARACEILIEAGAQKDTVNDKGETPLIIAARQQSLETVKMLLVKYEVDTQTADAAGLIAYDHALEHKKKGKAELADYLIQFQPGYEPPPPPPPPPPPVDLGRFSKNSDFSVDVKEKGLTMTFNFWTQQVIFRDPDAKQGHLTVVRFDDLPRQDAIAEAREMLERMGGRPPAYETIGGQKKPALAKPS